MDDKEGVIMAGKLFKLKIKYGRQKKFDDMMVTIKAYQSMIPSDLRKPLDNIQDIYEEALKYVGPLSYSEETKDINPYFKDLTALDGTIAVCIGLLAHYVAYRVDEDGYDIEKAIDNMLPKDYDKNNAFDVKSGYGHRVFGHDAAALGIRNIPVDYIVHTRGGPSKYRQAYTIGQLVGAVPNQQYVSMWDLVWKFYGNNDSNLKSICNCLSHTIVHYAKDLFTPAGLPLPLTSLLNQYTHEFSDGRISDKYFSLQYKNSLIKDLDKNTLNLRASDFASIIVIESMIEIYSKMQNLGNLEKDYKRMMKIISMATCLIVGFTKLLYVDDLQLNKHNKVVSGSRVNLLMTGLFAKNAIEEFWVIIKANKDIKQGYKEWGA